MAYFRCESGSGGGGSEFITVPIGILPLIGAGSGANGPYEPTVNLGSGYTKLKAIVCYYGPGATSGNTLGGSISFSINGTAVNLIKQSTERDETLAKAIEYWEGDIDGSISVNTINYGASGYMYNAGSKISIIYWLI